MPKQITQKPVAISKQSVDDQQRRSSDLSRLSAKRILRNSGYPVCHPMIRI